ncbi:MAG: hypothetical protein DWQ02_01765 [Bacteroidetes bacterium]|nr:MAG: hypothetical protein DWQ02_01765 [Bacteroidota bacterium]
MEAFIDDLIDNFRRPERLSEFSQLARQYEFGLKAKEKFVNQPYFLKGFDIFKGKKSKRLKSILHKDEPSFHGRMRIYDYTYYGEFKKRHTTIFEVKSEEFTFEKFEIRPKGALNQIQEFFIDKEKPFPEKKEFHGKYEIKTEDSITFEGQVGSRMLEDISQKKGLHVEGDADYLLVYYKNQKIPSKDVMYEYDFVLDLVEHILYDYSDDYV